MFEIKKHGWIAAYLDPRKREPDRQKEKEHDSPSAIESPPNVGWNDTPPASVRGKCLGWQLATTWLVRVGHGLLCYHIALGSLPSRYMSVANRENERHGGLDSFLA